MIDNDMPAVAESVAAQGDSGSRRVRHPEWCHIGRCTATPACAMGEAHHSEPVSVTVAGVYPVTVTMSLYRANEPWLTEVFVDVGVSGLVDGWREVGGSARCRRIRRPRWAGRWSSWPGGAALTRTARSPRFWRVCRSSPDAEPGRSVLRALPAARGG
jgi:hypothetical protein